MSGLLIVLIFETFAITLILSIFKHVGNFHEKKGNTLIIQKLSTQWHSVLRILQIVYQIQGIISCYLMNKNSYTLIINTEHINLNFADCYKSINFDNTRFSISL